MADRIVDLLRGLVAERGTCGDGADKVLIGLAGRGIQLSRTPGMHEREARRQGIGYSYLLLDFDRLGLPDEAIGGVIAAASRAGFKGLNVTHPFKQAVIASLDRLSPEAAAIGAVNTVVFGPEGTQGHNTDSWGFAESFREGMGGAKLDKVAMFGAGGAGAAVAHALMELGVKDLAIVDSNGARAVTLAERMAERFGARVRAWHDAAAAVSAADGVVNTTPVGMAKYPGTPFDAGLLDADKWVADIIYFPAETELLSRARSLGCRTLPGIGMAIYQAVRAFELFSGRKADRLAMAAHFEAAA